MASSLLMAFFFTSSRFVLFNVSKTGARGGIWGEESGFNTFFIFLVAGFFFIEARDEKDDPVDDDILPRSIPSLLFRTFLVALSDPLLFVGLETYPIELILRSPSFPEKRLSFVAS